MGDDVPNYVEGLDESIGGDSLHHIALSAEETYSFADEEIEEMEREIAMLQMQEDSSSPRPTWACAEAVDALEKVVISGTEREESCAVCLEEFLSGSKATKMPCSHIFHGDCIGEWLEVQRFCPLCHFELPPAQGDLIEWRMPSDAFMEITELYIV